jgi:hypothetical protein
MLENDAISAECRFREDEMRSSALQPVKLASRGKIGAKNNYCLTNCS